ncbi:PAS/PAC sensor signal transduction histidine kinase [Alicyclobacillus acidocaldarius subsp. acidocaldarius Tc-4-1]|uniref:histidine kinase n=2 Tax=Alicyclobacillus acidocaldarius TaxID=405212 RepID=F8IEU0_ALIAT|nr:PAS/PAC sensor signal transduction histidine kinase [Alicyclobacillus acidocaldarius subsp. acidocaldarius Tc-4-1]
MDSMEDSRFASLGGRVRAVGEALGGAFREGPDWVSYHALNAECLYVTPSVRPWMSEEDLVGRSFASWPMRDKDRTAWANVWLQVLGGRAAARLVWRHDRAGAARWVESVLLPDEWRGEMVGVMVWHRDVTDRHERESALEASIQRLQLAYGLARSGYWELDVATRRLTWSQEVYDIWETDPEHFAATYDAFLETVVPEDRPLVEQAVSRAMHTHTYELEYRIRTGRGQIRFVRSVGRYHEYAGGRGILFGSVQDVTAQKESELALAASRELLARSDKLAAVGQLAAGIAHEIRNPLTALRGFIDLMYQRARSNNRRYLEIMRGEVSRMEAIVSELLRLARPDRPHFQQLDLVDLVQEVVAFMSAQALLHGVEIQYEPRAASVMVEGDPNQLKQVFINLMRNGIEAMQPGGLLRVLLWEDGGWAHVQISDQGTGMPPEALARIGEPFFTTKEQGTGLGVMVSKRMVADHGGDLLIESEVGRGTTVTVLLPATKDS